MFKTLRESVLQRLMSIKCLCTYIWPTLALGAVVFKVYKKCWVRGLNDNGIENKGKIPVLLLCSSSTASQSLSLSEAAMGSCS